MNTLYYLPDQMQDNGLQAMSDIAGCVSAQRVWHSIEALRWGRARAQSGAHSTLLNNISIYQSDRSENLNRMPPLSIETLKLSCKQHIMIRSLYGFNQIVTLLNCSMVYKTTATNNKMPPSYSTLGPI